MNSNTKTLTAITAVVLVAYIGIYTWACVKGEISIVEFGEKFDAPALAVMLAWFREMKLPSGGN